MHRPIRPHRYGKLLRLRRVCVRFWRFSIIAVHYEELAGPIESLALLREDARSKKLSLTPSRLGIPLRVAQRPSLRSSFCPAAQMLLESREISAQGLNATFSYVPEGEFCKQTSSQSSIPIRRLSGIDRLFNP